MRKRRISKAISIGGVTVGGGAPVVVQSMTKTDTRNVAAIIPGDDAQAKSEAVVFSAHWDHLGIGDPVNGDRI